MSDPWGPPESQRNPDPAQGSTPPPGGHPSWGSGEYEGQLYRQPGYGAPAQPSYGPSPYGHFGGGQPAYGPPAVQTEQNAIIALVFAVLSWVVCPVVLAIVGVVLAGSADRNIAASGGRKTGTDLAKAARIISWLNIGLFGAIVGVTVVVLVIAAAASA